MENALSAAEQQEIKPFLLEMHEEWMGKGEEKGILTMLTAFIQKDPQYG